MSNSKLKAAETAVSEVATEATQESAPEVSSSAIQTETNIEVEDNTESSSTQESAPEVEGIDTELGGGIILTTRY